MATFSFSDLASDLGTATADGLKNVANTAANFACSAWEGYAGATTGFPDPTGIGAFNNALMSRLCTPRGKKPPVPPQQLFTGGQCKGKLYTVSGTYKYQTGGSDPRPFTLYHVPGPISGLKTAKSGDATIYGVGCGVDTAHPQGVAGVVAGSPSEIDPLDLRINSVTPESGTDDCGNPPPSYPPVTPPQNVTNNTTNINIGGGAIINVPISIVPVNFDVGVQVNPQLQVNVGPFNVTFDAGGVSVTPVIPPGSDNTTMPPPALNPSNPTTPAAPKEGTSTCDLSSVNAQLTAIKTTIDQTKTIVTDVKDCACPVRYSTSYVQIGNGNSGVAALPSNCIQVRLQLSKIPKNAKIQDGGANASTFYFCGYYAFGDGAGESSRSPLSVQNSTLAVPLFATSFRWTLYQGYDCTVVAVTLVPEKSGSQLATVQMKKAPT